MELNQLTNYNNFMSAFNKILTIFHACPTFQKNVGKFNPKRGQVLSQICPRFFESFKDYEVLYKISVLSHHFCRLQT